MLSCRPHFSGLHKLTINFSRRRTKSLPAYSFLWKESPIGTSAKATSIADSVSNTYIVLRCLASSIDLRYQLENWLRAGKLVDELAISTVSPAISGIQIHLRSSSGARRNWQQLAANEDTLDSAACNAKPFISRQWNETVVLPYRRSKFSLYENTRVTIYGIDRANLIRFLFPWRLLYDNGIFIDRSDC